MSTQAPTLPVIQSGDSMRPRLVRRAKLLSWLSLAWMTIEGAVGVTAGLMAGSVALTGFGLDSAIEGAASVIVIWRFTGGRESSEAAERRAQKLVGVSFFLLAPYIAVDAALALTNDSHPMTSWIGVALAAGSIVFMPLLGRAKARLGAQLGSSATAGEGAQNMLCAYMAAGVLLGLLANAALGWWWLDPAIGLGIAALAIKEGREAWAGKVCPDCTPVLTAPSQIEAAPSARYVASKSSSRALDSTTRSP